MGGGAKTDHESGYNAETGNAYNILVGNANFEDQEGDGRITSHH